MYLEAMEDVHSQPLIPFSRAAHSCRSPCTQDGRLSSEMCEQGFVKMQHLPFLLPLPQMISEFLCICEFTAAAAE